MNIFSPKNTGVAGNIWKYAILYITNKRPYITFLTIFLLTFPDTTVKTIGLLSLVGQIAGFLLEVPSGYISDYLGHKRALVIAKISFLLSSLCYVLATSTWYFFVGAILLAIGIAMNSGTQSAFLKESLDDLNLSTQYSSISGKLRSIGFAIPILLILLVSFVGDFNFRIGFSIVLVTDLIGLITVCTLISPKKQYETEEFRFRNIKKLFKTYTSLGWLKYVFFIEFMFALGFGVTGGFKNPFQESLGFSVFALGVFWAISRVGISGVLLLSGKLKERLTLKNFIVIQACLYTILFLGIGLTHNRWVIIVLFMLPSVIRWGSSSLRDHYYLEFIENLPNKASLLSINSFFEKIMTGIIGLMMGYSVLHFGYQMSYVITGVLFVVLVLLGYLILKNKKTEKSVL